MSLEDNMNNLTKKEILLTQKKFRIFLWIYTTLGLLHAIISVWNFSIGMYPMGIFMAVFMIIYARFAARHKSYLNDCQYLLNKYNDES